ncbi:T6SS immunity protein Tli4 family protein [Acinetobacter bereziniae]|uniref:T6SS immunity protein Tli4 family protein n=1 Tax=Acinetobacter bereziniae TaxID=106648 RepID=UPI00124DA523|nr:T6SS immunity protein Tli4 family protein [Acinetobacter bereziniae]
MNKIYVSLLLMICVFNTSCTSAKSQIKNTGNNMINLEKTKTYCIGRYVVDIPAEANPLQRYDQYDSFIIKVQENATPQDLNVAIEKVKKEYSEGDWFLTEDPPIQKIAGRLTKTLKGKTSKDQGDPFSVFGFVLDRRTLFLIEGRHSDLPKWTEGSNEAMQHLIKNLRYRPEHEIPQENGQCIYQGFIQDNDKKFRHSKQTLAFDFKDYPTVVLRFDAETNSRDTAPLIPRIENKLRQVGQSQRQIDKDNIRKGEKNTMYLIGQEWISIEKMKGKDGISALWEHTGTARDNKDPLIGFEVDTGYSTPYSETSSLKQFDAIKLYESILKTIRKFGE